jgi:hypothetical protein
MDIKTLFGLPAHPLLVHIPVVLIPLAAFGALGLWWKPWRDRFGIATAVILIVAGIFTQLAISSGQTLRHQLDNNSALVRAHVTIAEDIRPWLLLFFVALAAFLWFERKQAAAGTVSMRNPVLTGTLVATIVFAGISVYWVQRIGHTGAKAVWQPKMDQARQLERTDNGDAKGGG